MGYDEKREEAFLFDDIALLFSAYENHFSLLGELEFSHISLDRKSNNSNDVDLNVERLELSYALSDTQTIKIGRFNSDVGYWNQAPIKILQDTSTKPYVVDNFFPIATTGVEYSQELNDHHSFSLTFQHNDDLAHQDNAVTTTRHRAIAYHGISSETPALSWQINLGEFENSEAQTTRYYGVSAEYEGERINLRAELFSQDIELSSKQPYSGYVQSTWHVHQKQDLVARFESYNDKLSPQEQIYLLGYVYRPSPNIALKGEYVQHSELPLNRFVYSLSVLF